MRQLNIYTSSVEAMRGVTNCLLQHMAAEVGAGDFNIALSGGFTGTALFDFWVAGYRDVLNWSRMRIFWVDERCVNVTSPASNYGNAWVHLLSRVPVNPIKIFRIRGESDPETEAARYEAIIEQQHLHFAILGLGVDGHSASLFPQQYQSWRPDMHQTLCLTTTHPTDGTRRISLSVAALNRCDCITYLTIGAEKKRAVANLATATFESTAYPAHYIRPVNGVPKFYVSY